MASSWATGPPSFGDHPHKPATDPLAHFGLTAIDGVFLACQADEGVTLGRLLQPLPAALPASAGRCWPQRGEPAGEAAAHRAGAAAWFAGHRGSLVSRPVRSPGKPR